MRVHLPLFNIARFGSTHNLCMALNTPPYRVRPPADYPLRTTPPFKAPFGAQHNAAPSHLDYG